MGLKRGKFFLERRKLFRELAHLHEQIGDEGFEALISSDNTGKVKEFCDDLIKERLPTEMTVGGRTYEILGLLKGDEKSVVGHVMIDRAKKVDANLGRDDGQHVLKHQEEIPPTLRGRITLVFPDWRHHGDYRSVYYMSWDRTRWVSFSYDHTLTDWSGKFRFLRRK